MKASSLLRKLREMAGLHQAEAAAVYGMSQSGYSKWESGRRPPRADEILKMVQHSGFSVVITPSGFHIHDPRRVADDEVLVQSRRGVPRFKPGDIFSFHLGRDPRESVDLTEIWRARADGLIEAPDDAMAPMIRWGDWVGFHAGQIPQVGDVVVVEFQGRLLVRMWGGEDGGTHQVSLLAVNINVLPLWLAAADVIVLGPVVGVATLRDYHVDLA